IATSAPSRAKASAVACPIPESAPVTIATVFSRRMAVLLAWFHCFGVERRPQIDDGADQGGMYEALRKVADHLAGLRVGLLREEAEVVRVIQRPVDDPSGPRGFATDGPIVRHPEGSGEKGPFLRRVRTDESAAEEKPVRRMVALEDLHRRDHLGRIGPGVCQTGNSAAQTSTSAPPATDA